MDSNGDAQRANRPGRRPLGLQPEVEAYGTRPINIPHAVTLVEMHPHYITQMTKKVWIRGWYGENKVDESASVVFKKPDGSATVTPSSAVVVIDDPVNRTIVQAIECEVDFSNIENPEGLWDVEVECGEVHGSGPVTFYGMANLISVGIDVDGDGEVANGEFEGYVPGYDGQTDALAATGCQTVGLVLKKKGVPLTDVWVSIGPVTSYEGRCTNAGLQPDPGKEWDVSLSPTVNLEEVWPTFTNDKLVVPIYVKDYGAWARLRVETGAAPAKWVLATFTLPVDEDDDRMADAWERYVYPGPDPANALSLGAHDDEEDRRERIYEVPCEGDAIVAIDEYRGFMVGHNGETHERTDPWGLDMFVNVASDVQTAWSGWKTEVEMAFGGIGIQIHCVAPKNTGFVDLPGEKRFLCYNGVTWDTGGIRSGQRVVLIKQGALEHYALTWPDGPFNLLEGRRYSPITAGNVTLDLAKWILEGISALDQRNLVKHELGHNCGVCHHTDPLGAYKDDWGVYCVMGCNRSGSYALLNTSRRFCDVCRELVALKFTSPIKRNYP